MIREKIGSISTMVTGYVGSKLYIYRKLNCPTQGPHNIIQTFRNGTV